MGVMLYLFMLLFIVLLVVLYPLVTIAMSKNVIGFKKMVWFLFTLIFSWPVFILYLLVA